MSVVAYDRQVRFPKQTSELGDHVEWRELRHAGSANAGGYTPQSRGLKCPKTELRECIGLHTIAAQGLFMNRFLSLSRWIRGVHEPPNSHVGPGLYTSIHLTCKALAFRFWLLIHSLFGLQLPLVPPAPKAPQLPLRSRRPEQPQQE